MQFQREREKKKGVRILQLPLENKLCERLEEKLSDLNVPVDLDWLEEEEEEEVYEQEAEEEEEGTPIEREFLSFEGRAKQDNDRLPISLSLSQIQLFLSLFGSLSTATGKETRWKWSEIPLSPFKLF